MAEIIHIIALNLPLVMFSSVMLMLLLVLFLVPGFMLAAGAWMPPAGVSD